ncbi:MAG TPA: tRNA (guanosine(46)-N7)-methyltransferase TrmB [Myxococcota bacterium]|nr:tRNA (guanosine(46)-N7)-methyltransferase TrmB [Myxococcota bacterium]
MSRRLKTDIPGIDWRISPSEARERGFAKVFAGRVAHPFPLVVEIGFGRGEFLLELAQREPEQAFVGIEVSYKRALKMARRLARLGVANVAIVEARAEDVLRDAIEDASVACFWLNFPDPWPKKRHARRRFVQRDTLALLARRLVPGGLVRIATDDPDYAEWIDGEVTATAALANCYAPDRWRPAVPGRMATAYELEWRALGRSFHFFEYARR